MEKNFNKYLINIFMIFYCISVILDLHIFYNSISTFIRCLTITIFFFIILIKYSNKSEIKKLIIYFICVLAYLILHQLNANMFVSLNDNNFNYNTLSELLYFFKMLSNVFLFYIVYKLDIKYLDIKKYFKIVMWMMSLSIVVSDLLKVSYTAYNFSLTTISIYDWFKGTYDFVCGSSKGFFHLTNQIVAIFLLYLPIISYECFKNKKVTDYILNFLMIISMLMMGNRLSIYGTLIELIILLIIYIILNIKNLKNFYYLFNICLILLIILFIPYSPLTMRNKYYDNIYDSINTIALYSNQEGTINKKLNELKEELQNKQVDEYFYIKSYSYEDDYEFWAQLVKNNVELTGNARYVEIQMIKRVKQINNNFLDNFVGLTYVRVMNIFNIERDYLMQYYSIGIIGCILFLGLYFGLLIYIVIKILFDLSHKFNERNISLLIGIAFVLIAAYFSGNLLNSISIIIPLTFVLSILFNEVNLKLPKKKYEKILGFNVSTQSLDKIIYTIFHNDSKQLFIVNINPNIILLNKSQKKREIFNEQLIQIPDGEGIVLLSKIRGGNIDCRIAGIDLMIAVCQRASIEEKKIYLYGAKKEVVKDAKKNLEKRFPKIIICGYMCGYEEESKVIESIKKSKAEILFVALGTPLQEDFIIKNKDKLDKVKVFIPVGGSFDVISGKVKRAPKIIQKLKLEWLYRMIKQPKRFKGIIILIKFVLLSMIYREEDN